MSSRRRCRPGSVEDRWGCSPRRRRWCRLGCFVSAAVVGVALVAGVVAAGAVASVAVVRVVVAVVVVVVVAVVVVAVLVVAVAVVVSGVVVAVGLGLPLAVAVPGLHRRASCRLSLALCSFVALSRLLVSTCGVVCAGVVFQGRGLRSSSCIRTALLLSRCR